jgi:hypothetical protein
MKGVTSAAGQTRWMILLTIRLPLYASEPKLRAFTTAHVLVAAPAAMVLLYGVGLGANLPTKNKGGQFQ